MRQRFTKRHLLHHLKKYDTIECGRIPSKVTHTTDHEWVTCVSCKRLAGIRGPFSRERLGV